MAWKIIEPRAGMQAINAVETEAKHALGTKVRAVDPDYGEGEFVYVKGVTSGAVGSWVTLNPDGWTTTLLVADAIGDVGVLMAVLDAATDYGWAQIYGKCSALALASFADDGRVYATSTAGSVDDAVVDGDMVHKAKGASTITGAGLADFEIHYPYTDDINSND